MNVDRFPSRKPTYFHIYINLPEGTTESPDVVLVPKSGIPINGGRIFDQYLRWHFLRAQDGWRPFYTVRLTQNTLQAIVACSGMDSTFYSPEKGYHPTNMFFISPIEFGDGWGVMNHPTNQTGLATYPKICCRILPIRQTIPRQVGATAQSLWVTPGNLHGIFWRNHIHKSWFQGISPTITGYKSNHLL